MVVDGSITSSTGQVLVLTELDVVVSLGIAILLGETKISDVDLVAAHAESHAEDIRFDIPDREGLGVDVFETGDELIDNEEDSLYRELAVAGMR